MTNISAISEWLFKNGHLKERDTLKNLLDEYKKTYNEIEYFLSLEEKHPNHEIWKEEWYVKDKPRYQLEVTLAEAALNLWK